MAARQISLNPDSVARFLAIAAVAIVLASVAGQLVAYLTGNPAVYKVTQLSYVDEERNIPTAFSVFLLILAAALLALISAIEGKPVDTRLSRWTLLAIGFLFMAIDEAWSFHERLISPVRSLLGENRPEFFFYAWVVPAIVLVVALVPIFAGFLRRLPSRTRSLFLVSASLYLGGAIGFELVAGAFNEIHGLHESKGSPGRLHLLYSMIATGEESLEMAGSIVFIWSLLLFIAGRYGEVRFTLASQGAGIVAAPPPLQRSAIHVTGRAAPKAFWRRG